MILELALAAEITGIPGVDPGGCNAPLVNRHATGVVDVINRILAQKRIDIGAGKGAGGEIGTGVKMRS